MTDNSSHPDHTPETTPATAITPEHTAAAPRRSRTWLIAGGSVLAAVLLAGGGIAVGAAIADDMGDDDDRTTSDDGAASAVGQAAEIGTESATELTDIIDVASASAEGDPVAIEAGRDGSWDVTFETSAGEETQVRVAANGATEVVSTDATSADDIAPQGVLDSDTIDALVTAAMAEVSGRITDIEIDDDAASPFDISVVQANGRTVDLDLDLDMKVLSINPS
jgi:uncharacterized membrane protein YkoI